LTIALKGCSVSLIFQEEYSRASRRKYRQRGDVGISHFPEFRFDLFNTMVECKARGDLDVDGLN
jgi:hypothetical protein